MSVIGWWRWMTGTPPDAVTVYACPRCGTDVAMTGFGPSGAGYGPRLYRPTVAHVVRVCGCVAAGRPEVPEWPKRAARPQSDKW